MTRGRSRRFRAVRPAPRGVAGQAARARGTAISDLTAQRLSIYLRCLEDLERRYGPKRDGDPAP